MPTRSCQRRSSNARFEPSFKASFSEDFTATLAYNYGYSDIFNGNLYTTYDHRPAFLAGGSPVGQVAYNYDTIQLAETNQATLKLVWDTGTRHPDVL